MPQPAGLSARLTGHTSNVGVPVAQGPLVSRRKGNGVTGMKKRLGIGAVVAGLVASLVVVAAPSASANRPVCMEIQQPKVLTGVATNDGAQFSWENKGPGATYDTYIQRLYNGKWHDDDDWGDVGRETGQFVPWVENGTTADAVALSVTQQCIGQSFGVPYTVYRNTAPTDTYTSTSTAQTSYVFLTPNKKWTEVQVDWASVPGATEYEVKLRAPGAGGRCTMTLTGTSFTWTEDSLCPMTGKYGTYSAWVTPIGPDISGLIKASDLETHKKPTVRCVNKSTLKVKNFKKKKCPSGWVKR